MTDETTHNNGHRFQLAVGDFVGTAGAQITHDGSLEVAYIPNMSGAKLAVGTELEVLNETWKMVSSRQSDYVKKMIVLRFVKHVG